MEEDEEPGNEVIIVGDTDSNSSSESSSDTQYIDEGYRWYLQSLLGVGGVYHSTGRNVVQEQQRQEEEDDEEVEVEVEKGQGAGGGKACCLTGENEESNSQESQWNREIEGLFCSICLEAWTNEGDHHICCLPCGHVFGLSCINKWLHQNVRSSKCPQCNRKCRLKDVRRLFVQRIAAVDEESQKRILTLEKKCDVLKKKNVEVCKKVSEGKMREVVLQNKVTQLAKRNNYLESLAGDYRSSTSVSAYTSSSKVNRQGSRNKFVLKIELWVDGARSFDLDVSRQMLLLARRRPGMGGSSVLTKMSLISPYEREDIYLPPSTKAIKDLHISPSDGCLALCASLGKKLSVLSMESNNVVLSYDLPAAAWSCSWDPNCSHYVYAGLQNGTLLVFDVRQTVMPVESRCGLTTNPIHTLHCLQDTSATPGVRTVLSASSAGISQWNFGGVEERPSLIPATTDQGVCISLAYCASSDDIIATYRPRFDVSSETANTQPSPTPSPSIGQGILGFHLHLKRTGADYQNLGAVSTTANDIRLPKSTIIDVENQKPLFATVDEVTSGLLLQELPPFTVSQHLPHQHYICDVRYSQGVLGCLSENTLQLYHTMPL